jgi:hypothetical protein
MDFLSSRHLTSQDGYAHPFHHPGEFVYSATLSDLTRETESGIIIIGGEGAPEGKGKQYDVVFHWDSAARRFVPRESDRKLMLRPNDFVVFQFDAAVPGQPPCFILIRGKESIEADSRHLKTHDAYTHFFLNPGEYVYRLGEATYRISVADHRSISEEARHSQTQRPLVIMVNGRNVSVPHGRIIAGQTVIWAVERGEDMYVEGLTGEPNKPRENGRATAAS